MDSLNIALIGECMIELQQVGDQLRKGFGGDTLNTAVYLSRLTAGKAVNISYVTALGEDKYSQEMITSWQGEGINTQFVQRLKCKQPGLYMVETDPLGERSFLYWRNDSAAKYWLETADDQLIETLVKQDVIYLSGISLAILSATSREKLYQLLARCQSAGGKVIFDNNYRAQLWDGAEQAAENYRRVLAVTHTALLTFDDEQAVFADTCIETCIERTRRLGVQEIVIKQGAKACSIITPEQTLQVEASLISKEKIIDTNAAGDSFAAGYLSKRLLGASSLISAKKAHQVAATVIQHKGAIIDAQYISTLVD